MHPDVAELCLALVLVDGLERLVDGLLLVLHEGLLFPQLLDQRVEPVLDLILSAALDFFRDFGPLVAHQLLLFEQKQVFVKRMSYWQSMVKMWYLHRVYLNL